MLEIEMKFPVAAFQPIIAHLASWQAAVDHPVEEIDHYYNAPDRDFGKTDEALRLRQVQHKNVATYKGPKETGPTKTRKEIEVPLADGPAPAAAFGNMLVSLGFRPVATVVKRRIHYHFHREGFAMQACLDEVEKLGHFVEVEIVTAPEQKTRAQDVLQKTVHELGLTNPEKRSYLELVLSKV